MNASFWVCFAITAISATVSLGYSVHAAATQRTNQLAQYAAARSVALFAAVVVVAIMQSRSVLVPVAIAMVVVQALDALIGIPARKIGQIAGPAVVAVANLVALVVMQN